MIFTNDYAARDRAAWITWSAIGLLCVVFAIVYLHFSYGLSSGFMIAFAAVPVILGCLVQMVASKTVSRPLNDLAFGAYQAFVATVTVGCLVAGVLDIADSPSGLLWLFPALS